MVTVSSHQSFPISRGGLIPESGNGRRPCGTFPGATEDGREGGMHSQKRPRWAVLVKPACDGQSSDIVAP